MSRVKALVEQLEGARSLPTGRISPNSGGYIEIIVDDDEEDDFDDSKNYLVNLPLVVKKASVFSLKCVDLSWQ